jgi:hypothetical protein
MSFPNRLSLETPARARVKVLHPTITAGPSMHAQLIHLSDQLLQVRVPRSIDVGSTVQVRSGERVAFGPVRSSVSSGTDFEIEVDVERSS